MCLHDDCKQAGRARGRGDGHGCRGDRASTGGLATALALGDPGGKPGGALGPRRGVSLRDADLQASRRAGNGGTSLGLRWPSPRVSEEKSGCADPTRRPPPAASTSLEILLSRLLSRALMRAGVAMRRRGQGLGHETQGTRAAPPPTRLPRHAQRPPGPKAASCAPRPAG